MACDFRVSRAICAAIGSDVIGGNPIDNLAFTMRTNPAIAFDKRSRFQARLYLYRLVILWKRGFGAETELGIRR